jgi:hypothetical protein
MHGGCHILGIGFSYSRFFIPLSAAFAYYDRNGATTVGNLPFSLHLHGVVDPWLKFG